MKKVKELLNRYPFYVILFPWYSILFLFSGNYIKLSYQVIIKPLLITTIICLIFLLIFKLIFRKSSRGAILLGSLLLITFMYGPLRRIAYFNDFNIGIALIRWDYVYVFFSISLLIGSIIFLIKSKRELKRLNEILNIGVLLLMLLVIVPLGINYAKVHFKTSDELSEQTGGLSDSSDDSQSAQQVSVKPDIYYIIPDDYGSPDILKNDYGYDDSEFTNFLQSKGFYIAPQSKTNYPFSTFMIASVLNMNYLNSQDFPQIKKQPGGTVIDNALQNSKVLKFIKSEGYSYFYIGSWYDPLRSNALADINFTYDTKLNLDEFSDTLLHNTIFYPMVLRYFGLSGLENQIANTQFQYKTLANMPFQISPKFVFIDILSPHSPYIYDPNCNVIHTSPNTQLINRFVSQVQCVNKNLEATITSILVNSKTLPIIILQTDEGAKDGNNLALKYPDKNGVNGGFKNSSPQTNLERTKILSAFYLPGSHPNLLYPDITPVNTLRVVFDEYFNAKLKLLPDKVYTFDDYDKLYKFIFNDITDQVKNQ